MLAAAVTARSFGVSTNDIKSGLEKMNVIRGRVEKIDEGQKFEAVVDYAHTIDSLQKLYQAFPDRDKICVLGNTGGGRDKWKRAGMAEVAERNCRHIILTNEDPYDEDPHVIVDQMAQAVKDKSKVEIIMDRRAAIAKALTLANQISSPQNKIAVLISGKGTDPYIMLENGKKERWSDEAVTREELKKILNR
jgi:UDP-N-acetylmuramoyl-L-alanyl-D-glutamate--2,6-diaminopimelate ligase